MPGFFNVGEMQVTYESPRILQCGKCGLYKTCISPKMASTGLGNKKVLFVAEAPGKEEDRQGEQLIGESGQFLRKVLRKIHIELDDCWKTNAIICRPPKNKIEPFMISCCRPSLMKTIDILKPHIIIALGAFALESLLMGEWKKNIGPLSRWTGWNIPSPKYNAWICPTFHPSYILRMNEDKLLTSIFQHHLTVAFGLEKEPLPKVSLKDLESQIEIITSPREARLRMRDLAKKKGLLAFDYETTGLKPDKKEQRIVSSSFCLNGEDTFACMIDETTHKALRAVLTSERLGKVASNLKFEERWSRAKLNCGAKNWHWDTMLAAHLLDNRAQISSIKFQAYVHFGIPDYDSHISSYLQAKSSNQINSIQNLNPKDLLLYNGLDSILEYLVMEKQKKLYYGDNYIS